MARFVTSDDAYDVIMKRRLGVESQKSDASDVLMMYLR